MRRPSSRLASVSGERFGYFSDYPIEGSESSALYLLSTRRADGWSTQVVTPPQGGLELSDDQECDPSIFYSAELTSGVLADGWHPVGIESSEPNESCEGDDPPLVAGEPRGVSNLFLRDNATGRYQLIDMPPEGVHGENAVLADATPDLSHIVFSEDAQLTPEAPSKGAGLFEWSAGKLTLVSFLPDGLATSATVASEEQAGVTYPLSSNGERAFFYAQGALYVRLNAMQEPSALMNGRCTEPAKACTVQVDAAKPGAKNLGGDGVFMAASDDGSRVFLTDEHQLTAEATATAGKPDLYEYDVETGELTDLTVSPSEPADVLGYEGSSEDGSYLYFAAAGVLSEQANAQGQKASSGARNLYMRHAGVTTFIATVSSQANQSEGATAFAPDGGYLLFLSSKSLTGFDNEASEPADCEAEGGHPLCTELFLYDAASGGLNCVSCAPDGARPTAPARIEGLRRELTGGHGPGAVSRYVDDSGRVFFETADALLPQATNGAINVYEYEDGQLSLISSGTASGDSQFLAASASGNDVFFGTSQSLVSGDTDNGYSAYDARVEGGFPAGAGEVGQAGTCESAEACKSPPSEAPAEVFAASGALQAAGNLLAPPQNVAPPPSKPPASPRRLTHAQRLARALRACASKPKSRRRSCRAQARRRFGARSIEVKSKRRGGR